MTVSFFARRLGPGGYRDIEWETDEINMGQRNAGDLLRLLGFIEQADPAVPPVPGWLEGLGLDPALDGTVPDWCNQAEAADFLARVLLAEAMLSVASDDDEGRPDYQPAPNRYVYGRAPGTLARHLAELRQLADEAIANRAIVAWG